jgi:hypothetical protein
MSLIGVLIRKTSSSHASSSRGPAHRQVRSFKDKDEYRVDLTAFDILFISGLVVSVARGGGFELNFRKPLHPCGLDDAEGAIL